MFEREWDLVKKQFEMYPNFIAYVDSLHQHESRNSVTGRRSPAGIRTIRSSSQTRLTGIYLGIEEQVTKDQ